MTFHSPVKVGDVVCCYGRCLKIGRSSMRLKLEVWVKPVLRENEAQRYCVTEGIFTYVAIDEQENPVRYRSDPAQISRALMMDISCSNPVFAVSCVPASLPSRRTAGCRTGRDRTGDPV